MLLLSAMPQSHTPAVVGMALLALLPVAAVVAWSSGFGLLGRALLLSCFGLVSRPVELPAVAAALLVAEAVGVALRRGSDLSAPTFRLGFGVILSATASFACAYLVRVGLQRGLDFGAMDFAAGTFDSSSVSHVRTVLALVVKYAVALSLPGAVILSWQNATLWRPALRLLTAAFVLRYATMAAILFAPPVSYFSRFRMVGELGPDLVMALVATLAMLWLERRPASVSEHDVAAARQSEAHPIPHL
jgi:hypothetical protein